MTNLTTDVQIAAAKSTDLLAAVDGFATLVFSGDWITAEQTSTDELALYLTQLEQISRMAGELGFAGLQTTCLQFQKNLEARCGQDDGLDYDVRGALKNWLELVRGYLMSPMGTEAIDALISYLQHPLWDSNLLPEDIEVLRELLQEERQQAAAREEMASTETVPEALTPRFAESDTIPTGQSDESPEDSIISAAQPNEDLPPQVTELIAMLLEELPRMDESLAKLLQAEVSGEGIPVERQEAAEVCIDNLDRFAEAAETVGFSGLQQVVTLMRHNLDLLMAQPRAFSAGESELLTAWSAHAGLYLSAPYSAATCQGMIDWLEASEWPQPLTAKQAEALLTLLQAPTLLDLEAEHEVKARPQQAAPEDVSLALPEDVNTELLDALLQELPSLTETFSKAIHNLITGGSLNDVNVAQRAAHTLKGAANTVGVCGLANLTHHLEDILVALAKQNTTPNSTLALSLMNAADCLEAMGEALYGMGDMPSDAQAVLQEILDWANRIDREGLSAADAAAVAMLPDRIITEAEPAVSHNEIAPLQSELKPQTTVTLPTSTMRVATKLVDDLLRLGGETIILRGQVHEQVHRIDERMHAMHNAFKHLQQLGGELERLIDISDLSTGRRSQENTIDFDPLQMDQYNELHTVSRMLVEAAADANEIGGMIIDQLQRLDALLLTQKRLNRDTQDTVLSARMVPVKTVVPRLQRSVRQTCRLTGKRAELHIDGADTLIDREVLHELMDPLMHVLRNAVDHGIESAVQRAAAGKTDIGNIQLDFQREGKSILVRCRDDGPGFDYQAIRSAAEKQGLLEPGKDASEAELRSLLLMPNFSSRSEVTQTSGRGVGLDVVYSHVLSQGGSLTLTSESGKGCTTELRLPVSMISTYALLVRVRGQVMAVADRGIERILYADDGEQRKLRGQVILQVDKSTYPVKALDEILWLAPDHRASQRIPMPVMLVRERSGLTAVPVQQVMAGTDLVVKEFGRYLPRLPGIIGATILGDGAVTPVLDLPELLSSTRSKPAQTLTATVFKAEIPHLPVALVVDDSLSARRALVQVMADAGYEVREARDGYEAVQIVEEKRPDIVLTDIEMPRMNGIELTSHLRSRPETAKLPVIMITSRSTAKHRQQAEAARVDVYLTKPFRDDQLLEHANALRRRL